MKTAWTPENARAMRERIDKAQSPDEIANLEKSMDRLWNVGAFKQAEAVRLFDHLFLRGIELERGEA
jgi:hypothetical protein